MTAQPNSTEARDMAYHLHSCTNPRRLEREGPLIIDRGEGIHVFDNSGKRYIEGMAGLWSVAVGFGEKRLVEAARRQMSTLPYYHTFSQKSHGPVADLAVPPEGYWAAIQAVLQKYDILLIADEVICGFGRTGNMFGSQTFGIRPDIMTLSKQLSSSYQPIAALVINDSVYEPIANEADRIAALGHGFTASGHPVAAAVSLENLAIIEEKDLVGNVRRLSLAGSTRSNGTRLLSKHAVSASSARLNSSRRMVLPLGRRERGLVRSCRRTA